MINLEHSTAFQRFCFALSKTPREWRVDLMGIRRYTARGSYCPLTSVARDHLDIWHWNDATIRLELSQELVAAIVNAADGSNFHDPWVRLQLLAACGVEEHAEEER